MGASRVTDSSGGGTVKESDAALISPSSTPSRAERLRLPGKAIAVIVAICVTPALLGLFGVDLGASAAGGHPSEWLELEGVRLMDSMHAGLSGSFVHALLEWSAVIIALITALLSLVYFVMNRDVTAPVMGLALLCAGTIDAYHTLAAVRLISGAADSARLIPFTWALSRSFQAIVLMGGIGVFLIRRKSEWRGRAEYVALIGLVLAACACVAMYVSTTSPDLPQTIFPDAVVRRPWDLIPLVLFVLAAVFVLHPFHRRAPSLFSHAVLASVLPLVATQLHMAFGSQALFDHHFNSAHFLKVVAYVVPLTGIVLDYLRTYHDEAVARIRFEREAEQLGQYRLVEKIGEGGMGIVYKAKHAMLRRPTAIKLLPPEKAGELALARFQREVQLTSELTHPNTVAIYDYGLSSSGVFYYAMEHLDGIDLERLVTQYGAQPPGRVIKILLQACGALGEAHDRGLVHRDIKPANIILCQRGTVPDVVKVLDFGLVKDLEEGESTMTNVNVMAGTPAYIPPEAIRAPDLVGPLSDVYALGAVGYYLASGQRVFTGKTAVEVCSHHLNTKPIPPSVKLGADIGSRFEELLLQCLEKDPGDRPSAEQLREQLTSLPATGEWTERDALEWWRQHAAEIHDSVAPKQGTETAYSMVVDLQKRGPS